jgi:Zinc finger, C3HC4 type (RING finger)
MQLRNTSTTSSANDEHGARDDVRVHLAETCVSDGYDEQLCEDEWSDCIEEDDIGVLQQSAEACNSSSISSAGTAAAAATTAAQPAVSAALIDNAVRSGVTVAAATVASSDTATGATTGDAIAAVKSVTHETGSAMVSKAATVSSNTARVAVTGCQQQALSQPCEASISGKTLLLQMIAKLGSTKPRTAAAAAQAADVQREQKQLVRLSGSCSSDVKEPDSTVDRLKQQRNSQRTQLVTLRAQLAAQISQGAVTAAKLATVETKLAAAVTQAANCKKEANTLQLNLEQRDLLLHDSNTAVQKLEQQLSAERSQHAATKTELASMIQQAAEHTTTAEKLVSTESKLAAAVAQAVNVQQEKSELVQQLNRCTRDVKERDSSLRTLKQQRNSQRTALVTLREQLAAQTSQRADVVAALATAETKLAAAVAQAANCKKEVNVMQLNLDQRDLLLHDSNTAMQKLEQQLSAECTQHAATKTELTGMIQQAAEHAATAAKLVCAETELAAAVAQAADVQREQRQLLRQLDRCTSDAKERESAIWKLQQQRNSQRTELVSLRERLAAQASLRVDTEAKLAVADKKLEAFETQLCTSELQLATTAAELAAVISHLDDVWSEVTALRLMVAERERQLSYCEDAIDNLLLSYDGEQSWHARYDAEFASSQKQLCTLLNTEAKLVAAESKLATAVSRAVEAQKQAKALQQQTAVRESLVASLEQQLSSEHSQLVATKGELAAVSEQLLHKCSKLDLHEAEAAEVASRLKDIDKREEQATAAAAKAESIKRELRTLRKRDAEHEAALQQCRNEAVAAAAATRKQLKAVTEQFEELEERSVCVVCQHDPKQVLLQPCLHLCLCVKCSTSPKIKDCPICRAAIDYRETVHLC